ncbi:hypothetical protein BKP45_08085 [Anaerobacillus alkalidiazotrophicus]|uniref:Uncharacterized protein n=1 Tax=Anaerobacillus alkalidiazotrophicus TaxID=472963 RepID=A0A1S2M7M7_9BACI|nr:hypothetical protein BKP45_08085 [Anaerobacillus alkalidiazotrophicus]
MESLQELKPKLHYKEVVLESECDIERLPSFDMIFFLLTPTQIGHKFFKKAVEEVFKVRKNSKTIFLAIDDCHRLDDEDVIKVTLELKASIKDIMKNPTVFKVSSYYASLHHQFERGQLTLEDLRRNREVMVPTQDGDMIMGKKLQGDHPAMLLELSKMEQLFELVQQFSSGIRNAGIDVAKKNWLVVGPDRTGKSLLTNLLQQSVGENNHFVENDIAEVDLGKYYDGMFVIFDLEWDKYSSYLEKICTSTVGSEKMIIVNKVDDFMFFDQSRDELLKEIKTKIQSYTSDPIYFVSASYYQQYIKLLQGEITVDDIIADPEIILVDPLNFPINKVRNKTELSQLLLDQSGFIQLLQQIGVMDDAREICRDEEIFSEYF